MKGEQDMAEVIRRFENELGYTELVKFDSDYAVILHSDFAKVGSFQEYKYKQDAVATYQFNHWWLVANNKNISR